MQINKNKKMKYYSIDYNINRGIEITPLQRDVSPCEKPDYYKGKKFKIFNRKWVPDIFGMDCIGYFVVSEKFKKALEENNITGYKLIPIEIEGLEGKYYIMVETNRAKNLTPKDDIDNLYVDLNDLKKADFSRVENSRVLVASEKMVNALRKAKVKNLDIDPLEEVDNNMVVLR